VHSRSRVKLRNEAKRKGRHTGKLPFTYILCDSGCIDGRTDVPLDCKSYAMESSRMECAVR